MSLLVSDYWKQDNVLSKFSSRSTIKYAKALTLRIRQAQLKYNDVIEGFVDSPINAERAIEVGKFNSSNIVKNWIKLLRKDLKHWKGDLTCVELHLLEICGDSMPQALYDLVIRKIQEAQIPAGNMPGVIAAQSLSQPTMQMTLNSVSYNTKVMVKVNKEIKIIEIGRFIDQIYLYLYFKIKISISLF